MSIKKPCRVYACPEFAVSKSKWCKVHKPEMEAIEEEKKKNAGSDTTTAEKARANVDMTPDGEKSD